jgi:mannose-1-phosphate guanylyltransferase
VKALLLAAGEGVRLRPYTDFWPKCLMPIHGIPLLEHWLCAIRKSQISEVWVNVCHHKEHVVKFLARERFQGWVRWVAEEQLLGTAGTLREFGRLGADSPTLVVHADNWCQCSLERFLDFHQYERPKEILISMMTFRTSHPKSCGIVELDHENVVIGFHEKVKDPPSDLANGAVYIIEPEILEWIIENPLISDFSVDVLPKFIGRIATWENSKIHRDIGEIERLSRAQFDPATAVCWPDKDSWQKDFEQSEIYRLLDAK